MRLASILLLIVVAPVASSRADLIHDYPFTVDASDAVGNANGVLMNGATVSGGMLHLSGDAYVQFSQQIVPTSGSYTVSLREEQTSTSSSTYVELISQGYSGGPGFYIGFDNSAEDLRVSDSWETTGVPIPSNGAFHTITVTVDATAGVTDLYIDGTLKASLNSAISTTTAGYDTRLGRQFDPYAEYFQGNITNLRIYNNALSASEVAALSVPEPSSHLPLAVSLVGVLVRRRK